MTTPDVKLPPRPEPKLLFRMNNGDRADKTVYGHTDEAMQAYALEAVELNRPKWLPIAEAPKDGPEGDKARKVAPFDGKPVLICTDHTWTNPVHRVVYTDAVHGHGIFSWAIEDHKHGPYPLRGWSKIIGWQPLPEPPQ